VRGLYREDQLIQVAKDHSVPLLRLGVVQPERITVNGHDWGPLADFAEPYEACWPRYMARDVFTG
jgi:hypothetical protein